MTRHGSGGGSYNITARIRASLAMQSGLSNDVEGTWMTTDPADGSTAGIPNTSVTNELSTHTVIGGVSVSL